MKFNLFLNTHMNVLLIMTINKRTSKEMRHLARYLSYSCSSVEVIMLLMIITSSATVETVIFDFPPNFCVVNFFIMQIN